MNPSVENYVQSVIEVYGDLDKHINSFSQISGLKCPDGCGICCENPNVETTALELLPLAHQIYFLGKESEILQALDFRKQQMDTSCVLYKPDPEIPENGRCSFYLYRPLICRLFGFAARKNKYNQIEFTPCKIVKQKTPHLAQQAKVAISNGILPPLYQQSSLRVASVLPSMGFRRFPINRAIWEALAYFQWKKPITPQLKSEDA